jgi:TadE-like protein
VRKHDHKDARRRRQDAESGQAMVEFALILFPLLLLVAGIIQFGIGLNYWLDMQRVANQGARWAAVNNWPPDCARGSTSCTATPPCNGSRAGATLQNTLYCQAIADGLQRHACIEISYPGLEETGEPVRVHMKTEFDFLPILGIGTIEIGAHATMRLEQDPDLITGEGAFVQGEDGVPCPY